MRENRPKEKGIYFAKGHPDFEWWNLLVEVIGEPPWLSVDWVFNRSSTGAGVFTRGSESDVSVWGPKIEEPIART